jgi:hypothetical protein
MRVVSAHWLIYVSITNNYSCSDFPLVAATVGIGVYWASWYFVMLLDGFLSGSRDCKSSAGKDRRSSLDELSILLIYVISSQNVLQVY